MNDLTSQFPQKVEHKNLFQVLQHFYKKADRQIVETFKQVNRRRSSNMGDMQEEDLSELEYNDKQFHRIIRELKQKKSPVKISWYDAQILGGADPRLKTQIKEFKIKFRYGSWFKETNSLR